jgi:magnesium chelatase subunit D
MERRPGLTPWPNLADHLRYKLFRRKEGRLYILAIDTSGSMALRRIKRAREIALGLLHRSYVKRDHVAVVVFRGESATIALPPTRSILRAKKALDHLRLGGATPLAAGIVKALELAKLSRVNAGNPVMVLFTDGGANVPLNWNSRDDRKRRQDVVAAELTALGIELKKAELRTIVVDTEERNGLGGAANALATRLNAELLKRSEDVPSAFG